MLLSPILLFWTTLSLYKAKSRRKQQRTNSSDFSILGDYSFEKLIAVGGVCIHAGSLASSSFVEEEQYTYHFLVSTLSIVLLRRALQQPRIQKDTSGKFSRGGGGCAVRVLAVAVILLCGRLLRAWHRSGVNWTHLPDIAKWLETVNVQIPITLRYAALLLATTSSCLLILSPSRRHLLRKLIACCLCLSASLIFVYVDSQSKQVPTLFGSTSYPDQVPTLLARLVFGILGNTALLAVTLLPWIEPLWWNGDKTAACSPSQEIKRMGEGFAVETVVNSTLQSTGRVLISCWCLLQVLLQQSINAGPVALLLVQLLATVVFFGHRSNSYELWFQVSKSFQQLYSSVLYYRFSQFYAVTRAVVDPR
jgi:ethanolaminephosphotransferase